jgi:hypothetical protein
LAIAAYLHQEEKISKQRVAFFDKENQRTISRQDLSSKSKSSMKSESNCTGSTTRISTASSQRQRRSRPPPLQQLVVSRLFCLFFVSQYIIHAVHCNPYSKAYIPYRTDPYDQPASKSNIADFRSDSSDDHNQKGNNSKKQARPRLFEPSRAVEQKECPLRFSLGVSRRSNNDAPGLGSLNSLSSPLGIQQPPIIYPILPWQGPGRQVLYATQYEHLDMLTPSKGDERIPSSSSANEGGDADAYAFDTSKFIREGLAEHLEFPLLFESSAFQTNPVIADVNDDGILDAILTDYHGGLYAIGLQVGDGNENHGTNHRYFLKAQVPRMYVRRQWMEAMVNETLGIDPYEAEEKAEEEEREAAAAAAAAANGEGDPHDETASNRGYDRLPRDRDERPHDPYHSYFEYSSGSYSSSHETILRGVTANVLEQDQEHVQGLEERRNRNHHPPKEEETVIYDSLEEEQKNEKIIYDSAEEEEKNEKIIYDSAEEDEKNEKIIYDSAEEEEKNEKIIYDSAEEEEKNQKTIYDSAEEEEKNQKIIYDSAEEEEKNQKTIYDSAEEGAEFNHRRLEQVEAKMGDDPGIGDDTREWGEFADDLQRIDDDYDIGADTKNTYQDDDTMDGDETPDEQHQEAEGVHVDGDADTFVGPGDDDYPRFDENPHHDDYSRYNNYDDYYSGHYSDSHEDYFDDKHYIRLPPHILSTPVLAELPKLYSNKQGETENLLFLAVSYYFDEDEYEGFFSYKRFENSDHGDETETKRGMYTANAIMVFHFGSAPRWGECHQNKIFKVPTDGVNPFTL